MMKKIIGLVVFLCCTVCLWAQDILRGTVLNEKGEALTNASIYIPNSSKGTMTDNSGYFSLANLPAGNFSLVVSSIGYEVLQTVIGPGQRVKLLNFRLRLKAGELNEVLVRRPDKDGWKKWGQSFLEAFIGNSDYAPECLILNKEKIQFVHDKTVNILRAYSNEPLLIENKALGYSIKVDLVDFTLDMDKKEVDYQFYSLFTPMQGTEAEFVRWKENREEAYAYSLPYFIRLVATDQFNNKYAVRRLQVLENTEKTRVKNLIRVNGGMKGFSRDSTGYYQQVLEQPDRESKQYPEPVLFSDIARKDSTGSVLVQFPDYLLVSFRRKKTPSAYTQYLNQILNTDKMKRGTVVQYNAALKPATEIRLLENLPLEISADGYFLSNNLFYNGFWGWWEKLGTRLPAEYPSVLIQP